MYFAAVTALWGRQQLAELMLVHNRPFVDVAIAVCSNRYDSELAESCEWEVVWAENHPLGAKWNAGTNALRTRTPDGVMTLGSDDFVTGGHVEACCLEVEKGFDMAGVPDLHIYDTISKRLVRLEGNPQHGAGRMYSREVMEAVNWRPWEGGRDSGLDGSLFSNVSTALGRPIRQQMVDGFVLDVKTTSNIWSLNDLESNPRLVRQFTVVELPIDVMEARLPFVAPSLKTM